MKALLLSGTIFCSAMASQPVIAQDAAAPAEDASAQGAAGASAEDDTRPEEILVTARRREERLQSIPAAVTAVTQEALTRSGATDINDIARLTPGLTYSSGNAGGLGAPTLRGVTNVTTTTFDNNVGVFVEGVYLSAKSNLDIDLFNLARVEVIKGPQSALYGNNAFAGAVNYVLARPNKEFSGRVRATFGTDDLGEIAGRFSVPITGGLSAQLVGTYSHFDGTIRNVRGPRLGGWDHKSSVSGMLDFDNGGPFTASIFYYHYEDEQDGSANFIFTNNCGGPNSLNTSNNRGGSNLRFVCGTLEAPDAVNVDEASFSERRTDLVIGRAAYDFGPFTVRYTGSSGKYKAFALQDQHLNSLGGLPTASRRFTQPFVGPVKEFSSELRLESFGNSFFDWAFGGYYYDRTARQLSIVGNGPEQRAKSLNNINEEEATQKSVFALTSFHLTRTLELEAQGRWTWEDKSAILTNALPAVPVVRSPAADFSYGTYRLTGSWRWLDDNTLYAVVASGTKSGGFNNTVILSEQSFGPEKNTTFEIGSKNQLFNRTLTLNASAYYIDWSNLQLPVPSAVAGQVNFVRNIGSATVKGFEIFAAARPVENLDVSLGYSYTDPKWKKGTIDFSSARACATPAACGRTPLGGGIDIGGFQIPRTSRHQLTAAGTFTIPLQDSELYIRGDASYRSSQVTLSAIALQRVPAQTLVNGRVGWVKENHEISLFVKNAFDKSYIISSINEPEFFPVTTFTTGFLGNGRIIGLTLETGF